MRPISVLVTAPILLSLSLGAQLAAQIMHIANAPFTATVKYTTDGGLTYSTEQLARASNGSTYIASKAKDGHPVWIHIEDVPNNRIIELSAQPPSYTYRFVEAPKGGFWIDSIDSYRERLQRFQDSWVQNPDRDEPPGGRVHRIIFGTKQENGMTLFGETAEFTLENGEKRTEEKWESDLGLTVSRITDWHGETRVRTVTDVERVEPNPILFEIPKEYLPHNDPLLEAKTVFVENRTGDAKVKAAVERVFNNWKHMTITAMNNSWKQISVTDTREKADLIAVFTKTTKTDLDPGIEMRVYLPNSGEPLFTTHSNLAPPINPNLSDSYIATNCVDALWGRIANTRIGLIDTPRSLATDH
jgi:hypothetical protein